MGAIFLVTITALLVGGPSTEIPLKGEPIALKSDALVTSAGDYQEIPELGAENPHRQTKVRAKPKFRGIEHIGRPKIDAIPPGISGEAILVTAAIDGKVSAEMTKDLVFNGDILIEKGTVLLGTASSREDRLNIVFSRARFADGTVAKVSAMAMDKRDQVIGLKGSKVSKYMAMLAASAALSFAGGLAEGLQETEQKGEMAVKKSNLRNAALNGTAHAALDTSKEVISKWKDKKNYIQVEAGTQILVSFDGE